MPIFRYVRPWNSALQCADEEVLEISYVGRVYDVFTISAGHRALSDVYTNATFASIINDDGTLQSVLVNANFGLDTSRGHAVIDVTKELLDKLAARQAILSEQINAKRSAEVAERDRISRFAVGQRVIITAKHKKCAVNQTGTIARIISKDGLALVKSSDSWRDRASDGVWVPLAKLRQL